MVVVIVIRGARVQPHATRASLAHAIGYVYTDTPVARRRRRRRRRRCQTPNAYAMLSHTRSQRAELEPCSLRLVEDAGASVCVCAPERL